jgi:hypothetical protein
MDDLMDILKLLVLPCRCYHDVIEEYFEHPTSYESEPFCNNQCSFCDGTYANMCGPVSKARLIALLTTSVFENGKVSAMSLLSMISSPSNKRVKEAIWRGKKDVTAGSVHALILMLIAANILHLSLEHDPSGHKVVPLRNVQVSLKKQYAHVGDDFETLSLFVESNWANITCAY